MNRYFFVALILLLFLFPKAQAQTITAPTVASGTISACEYFASASPNLQQFTISGSSLTGSITITSSGYFEISTSAGSGYSFTVVLPQTGGTVNNTTIYVRSASTNSPGAPSIKLEATSPGAGTKNITVSATVNTSTTVDPVSPASTTYKNGDLTTAVSFSGTATNFSWTNDTPAIGLAANGTGNIAPFTAVNTTGAILTATITVSPQPATPGGCAGPPVTFKIIVQPELTPVLTVNGSLSPLNTIYGTPSTSTIFTVSATNLQSGVLVGPLTGFEFSTDGNTFGSTVTAGSTGTLASTTIYVRLPATDHVNHYSGSIPLTSTGAAAQSESMPLSVVTAAPLSVIADDKSRAFGVDNPVLTASYIGFVNGDGPAQLTTPPLLTTTATITSAIGQYPITAMGAASTDYNITYVDGVLTIIEPPTAIMIPNTFTPNGDGVNDTWNIKYLSSYVNCLVDIFNRYGQKVFTSVGYGTPWDGTYKGSKLPVGTYYYVIDLKTGYKPFSGYIAILR